MAHGKIVKRQLHQVVSSKEGEGAVIGMVVREKTSGTLSIRLDFSNAPVPERRFSADGAWVECGSDMVRIMFAQYKAAGPDIEHVVVLRMPFDGVRQFLVSMAGVARTAQDFLKRVSNPASPEVNRESIPNQTFTLDANLVLAGFSGREACLDLYSSSPQVKAALVKGAEEFRAEPIARVTLATRLMMDIHDSLNEKLAEMPNDGDVVAEVDNE